MIQNCKSCNYCFSANSLMLYTGLIKPGEVLCSRQNKVIIPVSGENICGIFKSRTGSLPRVTNCPNCGEFYHDRELYSVENENFKPVLMCEKCIEKNPIIKWNNQRRWRHD